MCSGGGNYAPQCSDLGSTKKNNKVGFQNWWYCMACEAKGPDMNNTFCAAYAHKRGKNFDSDHSDGEDEDQYPGTKTRNEAYLRIVENHKDSVPAK
eukprot:16445964-Heterocapsa_arctica.AAC.1